MDRSVMNAVVRVIKTDKEYVERIEEVKKVLDKACTALANIDKMPIATMRTDILKSRIQARINALVKLTEFPDETIADAAREALDKYVDEQKELFAHKGLNETRAYSEMIVPYMDGNRQLCRIIKRSTPINPDCSDENRWAISRAGWSFAKAAGIDSDQERGKYRDGAILIEQSAASVDRSEKWGL